VVEGGGDAGGGGGGNEEEEMSDLTGKNREPLHDITTSRNANQTNAHSESAPNETSSSFRDHSQPPIIPCLSLSNVVTPSKTPPPPPAEDPYRRHGQEQFLEEEVRLKRALRDQMASHAERLSARMSKMSSTSLEALQRKVENLEDIMVADAHRGESGRRPYLRPNNRHERRRDDADNGGGGEDESGNRISNQDTSYRPFSVPSYGDNKIDLFSNKNIINCEGNPSANHADFSTNQTRALARSFDVSLSLTPGSSRVPPPTNAITPPSGVRRGAGKGGVRAASFEDHLGDGDASCIGRRSSSKRLEFKNDKENS